MPSYQSRFMKEWEAEKSLLGLLAEKYGEIDRGARAISPDEAHEDLSVVRKILAKYADEEQGNPALESAVRDHYNMIQRCLKRGGRPVPAEPTELFRPKDLATMVEEHTEGELGNVVELASYRAQRVDGGRKIAVHSVASAPPAADLQEKKAPEEKRKEEPKRSFLWTPPLKPHLSTKQAEEEYQAVQAMDETFNRTLEEILTKRLDATLAFGRDTDISTIADYLKKVCGPLLYFDSLLTLVQQYALADVPVVNPAGKTINRTGFNLAFFGDPATGKSFASYEMIMGNPKKGIPAHGLVGRNRYSGNMSAAQFIRIGEAYQGRTFNFIVTEFSTWLDELPNPLKTALESGMVGNENASKESVRPYPFTSFFSVNYNKPVRGPSAVSADPDVRAIEDRMLGNLHRKTDERTDALRQNERRLALGDVSFDNASALQDHVMLVYAIQTGHPYVVGMAEMFPKKEVVLTPAVYDELGKAWDVVRQQLQSKDKGLDPLSMRLQQHTLQLACAMALPSYFRDAPMAMGDGNSEVGGATATIEIGQEAIRYALRFFVNEAVTRSNGAIEAKYTLAQLGMEEHP